MNVEKKVPEIRFDGFSGEWENKKLRQIATYRNGKAHEQSIAENGRYIVVNSKFVSTNGEVIKYSNEQISPLVKNEICFVLSDVPNGKAIARTFLIAKDNLYTLNQRIAGITPSETSHHYFLYILLNRNPYFLKFDDGVKQTNLSVSDVESFTSPYPSVEEQTAIGNTFQKLDSLINQHQQQHDQLSNIKKAMLEKMFPKPGETIPKIRFKGFSGEWESEVLGSVVSFYKGKGLPKSSIQDDGVYPCIHYGELFTKYSEVIEVVTSRTNQRDNIFSACNDVLMPTSDVTPNGLVKPCCVKQSGVVLGGDILVIRPNDKSVIDGAFLGRFIRTREQQVLQNVTGSTVFHLYASSIESLDIVFPSIEEQTAIGNYFQKLDALINQHQQQISKLTHIKQACLSKMFV